MTENQEDIRLLVVDPVMYEALEREFLEILYGRRKVNRTLRTEYEKLHRALKTTYESENAL